MSIIKKFSRSLVERTYQRGFDEASLRKTITIYSVLAIIFLVSGIVLASIFGLINTSVLWLFFAGLFIYGSVFVLVMLIIAGLGTSSLAYIFFIVYFMLGMFLIPAIPMSQYFIVPLILLWGIWSASIVALYLIELITIKKSISNGAVFPSRKAGNIERKDPFVIGLQVIFSLLSDLIVGIALWFRKQIKALANKLKHT
jgi:hypothetical protein